MGKGARTNARNATAAAELAGAILAIPKQQARAEAPPGALLASDVADYFVVVYGDPERNKIGTVRRVIPKEAAGLREVWTNPLLFLLLLLLLRLLLLLLPLRLLLPLQLLLPLRLLLSLRLLVLRLPLLLLLLLCPLLLPPARCCCSCLSVLLFLHSLCDVRPYGHLLQVFLFVGRRRLCCSPRRLMSLYLSTVLVFKSSPCFLLVVVVVVLLLLVFLVLLLFERRCCCGHCFARHHGCCCRCCCCPAALVGALAVCLAVGRRRPTRRTAAAELAGAILAIPKQQARAEAPPGALLASDVADYFVVVYGDPERNKIGTVRRVIPKEAAGLRESALPAADDVLEIELYRDVAAKQLLHAHAPLPAPVPPALFSEASLQSCGLGRQQLQQDMLLVFKCEGCGKKFRSYEKACRHEQRCKLMSAAATARAPELGDGPPLSLQQRALPWQQEQQVRGRLQWNAADTRWKGNRLYRGVPALEADEEEEEDCVEVEEQEYKELGVAADDVEKGVASLNAPEELLMLQRLLFPESSSQIVQEEVDLHAPAKKRL
eukprot:XP_028341133.1 uncharacterized protein LOC114485009 [Physeter catodon]